MLESVGYWLAIGFGLGLMPVAPGTFGSLLGPILVWGVQTLTVSPLIQAGIGVVLFLLGVPICEIGAKIIGRKDPGAVVYDEIIAFFVVFAFHTVSLKTAILGFIFFRIFDISKPWPIRRLEKLPAGWGVMADDLMAGVYACAALALSLWLLTAGFS